MIIIIIIIINVNTLLVSFFSLKMLLRLQLLKQNKEYFDESLLYDSDTLIKERKQKIRSICFMVKVSLVALPTYSNYSK